MTGIILIGHGNIATGMQSAVKLIFGEPENFQAIDFTQDVIPELLKEKLEKEIEKIGEEILILSDIAGGTPFKTASILSTKKENIKVISGMNLPMILEIICERENMDFNSLYLHSMETGKIQITGFELNENKSLQLEENSFENGI